MSDQSNPRQTGIPGIKAPLLLRLAAEQMQALFPTKLVFPITLMMLALLAWIAYHNITTLLESDRREEHTQQVIQEFKQWLGTQEGPQPMETIRHRIDALQNKELRLLQHRSAEKDNTAKAAIRTSGLGLLLSMALLSAVFLVLRREIAERVKLERELADQRDSLELSVQAHTAELEQEIARHRAVERALRENEERLRLVLQAGSMGTFEIDLSNGHGQWNPVEFELLGLEPGEAPPNPETFFRFVHPDDKALVSAQWEEAIRTGLLDCEFRIVRTDGELRWLAGRGRFALGDQTEEAEARRFLGVNFDITERKRAEARLQRSEAALARAQTIANIGSWEWDLSTGEVRWSDQMYRIFDIEPRAWLTSYEAFLDCIHPDDRQRVDDSIHEALAKGLPFTLEYRVPHSRLGNLTILAQAEVELAEDGSIARVCGTCLDITERKAAETAMARLAAIVESSQDAIIGKDLFGRVTSWNQGAENLFGYTEAEILGQPITILFPPKRSPEEIEILERIAQGQAVAHYETERLRKDGSLIFVSITVSPIKDASGKLIGTSKIARDITARKHAEEERDRYITLVKNSTDFIGMCDLQGAPFFVNEAGMKLLGIDGPEHLSQIAVRDCFFPEDQEFIIGQFLPGTLQNPAETEVRFRHFKTSEAIWMIYSVFALRDKAGHPTGFATVSRNISERKRMEQLLLANEQFKQGVFDSLHAHIAVLDGDGVIRAVNQPWLRFAAQNGNPDSKKVGVGANYLETCRLAVRNGDSSAETVLKGLEAVMRGDLPSFEMEYPCDSPGQQRWFVLHILKPSADIGGAIVTHTDITERKLAEDALRQTQRQNAFLANILENSSQPFGVGYPNRHMGLSNRAFQALVGYSAEELKTMDWYEALTPEEWRKTELEKLQELEQTGQPVRYEKEYRRKDGNRVPVELLVNVVKDTEGTTEYYYGFISDISERKRAEDALRQERLFLREVIDAVPSLIFVKDSEGRILLCNDAFARDYGATVDDLIGKTNAEINPHSDEVARFYRDDREVINTGRAKVLWQEKVTHADATVHWYNTVKLPMRNAFGVRDRVLGVATDITVRKLAEEALRQSQADLNRAQAVAHTGSWRLDVHLNVLSWSDENYRIFGLPKDTELSYENFLASVHPEDQEFVDKAWNAALGGAPYDIEHRIITGDTVKWLRERAELEFDEDGRLLSAFGTTQDISELKNSQQALQEADRRKDEFLAMLAHELRNPLTPIMVAAQMLIKRGASDPALVTWVANTVKHQGENLTHLVNQLLDVSRVTQGKITLRRTSCDLRELLEKAVESCKPFIDQHQHELILVTTPEAMPVEVDTVRIEQVLGNLLNNAAKYTPKGGKIWLSLERQDDTAVIRVRDTGIGISAATLPSVFDLFVQAERTLDRAQGGLGIGLALVKSLVERHGGSVKAFSHGIGMGSEFEIRLPLLEVMPAAINAKPEVSSPTATKPRRILVVDDNNDVRTSMALLLRAMGHAVWEAENGQEALELAKLIQVDAVILDIGMPGLDGYEVARRLRQDPAFATLTLIAMTGYSQGDLQESIRAGFNHHMVKPVDPAELAKVLADLV